MQIDDDDSVPRHLAIIMDGNGRWATGKSMPRAAGHKQGLEALRRTVTACSEIGIAYLTLYAFSTENWSRPQREVGFLLDLLKRFIRQDVSDLHAKNVRIKVIGGRDDLDSGIRTMLVDAEKITAANTGLTLVIAFNYGGKQEIVRAVQQLAARAKAGELRVDEIGVDSIAAALDTCGIPDPDLLIRTGGEKRISNFLLWQLAYAEFIFVPEFWPDFNADVLTRALDEYRGRDRRFGGLKAQSA
jgi:undecaprenyl diphosphate synthase